MATAYLPESKQYGSAQLGSASPQVIDLATAKRTLRAMVPEWVWLLKQIESDGGYVKFPRLFTDWITNLNIGNYPILYENEKLIGSAALMAVFTPSEIAALDEKLFNSTPSERGEFLDELVEEALGFEREIRIPKTSGEMREANEKFAALSEEEKRSAVKFWQYLMMSLLASFYQSLSVMVHGEKLTSLVCQAKNGNDKAFAKAVQIDKRILFSIPYFSQRYARSQLEGDHKFSELIGAHLQRPPYRGKIRHKALYLAFAFLDQAGVLQSIKHRDLLDICNEAGIDSHASRIDDVKNLTKRLAEYRAFQLRT